MRLAAMPFNALVATRHATAAAQGTDIDAALAQEARLQSAFGAVHDHLEGADSFRSKRVPHFTDR